MCERLEPITSYSPKHCRLQLIKEDNVSECSLTINLNTDRNCFKQANICFEIKECQEPHIEYT